MPANLLKSNDLLSIIKRLIKDIYQVKMMNAIHTEAMKI